jgi:ornithine cyclodeaminase/alanine dehydrogenase-like protein (mu-crystallin family)
MSVLILNHDEVEQLLGMNDCLDVMAQALEALAREQAFQPLRSIVRPPGGPGFMGLMPGYSQRSGWGLKVVNIYPENPQRGLDAHQGAVLLFDGETGETKAVMNASAITAIRTAAVSGVATRLLAREDASVLAVLGAGVQARSHLQAMSCAMRAEQTLLWSRDFERARALAADFDGVTAVESCADAVRDADVICTTTGAREPIIERSWLRPGVHINAVGASVRTAREVDTATMSEATVFADRRESAENEAGDILLAREEGATVTVAAELGDVIASRHPGRTSDDEITVFKSLGLAVEDLAAAEYLYGRAQQQGVGTWVAF